LDRLNVRAIVFLSSAAFDTGRNTSRAINGDAWVDELEKKPVANSAVCPQGSWDCFLLGVLLGKVLAKPIETANGGNHASSIAGQLCLVGNDHLLGNESSTLRVLRRRDQPTKLRPRLEWLPGACRLVTTPGSCAAWR
jgi:hypothetical protein